MIENGVIKSTMLGYEGHGIFTLNLHIEFGAGGCSYGGYALDQYDKAAKCRRGTAYGLESIIAVLRALDVESWERVPGTFVRVDHGGIGGKILRIGHLMKDQWLDFDTIDKEPR